MNDLTPSTFLQAIAGELDVLASFRTITGFEPDKFQRTLLVTGPEEPLIACLAGRGTGKSLTIAIKAICHANTTRDAVVLCLSASLKQATELFRTIKIVHSKLPLAHMITRETAFMIQLQNGARIIVISASESTSRGYRATLILADEAARIEDEIFTSLIPSLVANGQIVLVTTPNGARGFFYEVFTEGRAFTITAKSTDLPRMKAICDRDQALMSESQFRAEHLCSFQGSADNAFFSFGLIQDAFANDIKPANIQGLW